MQIDFIGCTSAGKSTLIRNAIQASREHGLEILDRDSFVLKQVRLNWVRGHVPRTLLVDLAALSACLLTLRRNFGFYRFSSRHLVKLPTAPFEKLNLLRNVFKKIGIHEIIRFRSSQQQIILVDEGVLQAAHNLFVHNSAQANVEDLATFMKLIPMPDVIVYVRQPESLLIDRTMNRGHKRLPDRSYGNVAPFIKEAVSTFDRLLQEPEVKRKLWIIENTQIVTAAASSQDDPLLVRALNIVRNGMLAGLCETPQAGARPCVANTQSRIQSTRCGHIRMYTNDS